MRTHTQALQTPTRAPNAGAASQVVPWLQAGREVKELAGGALRGLRAPRTVPGWQWSIAFIWLLGIIGDAVTTIFMMQSGKFEEGNPIAAAGMNILGVGGYTAVASVVCLALATLTLGHPRGLYGRTVWGTLAVIGALKAGVAADNLLLWVGWR